MSILLKNSVALAASRLLVRFIGLISTLVVVRLLTPDDYAVIATCMIVQELGTRLENTGFGPNLISRHSLDDDFLGTLFTLKVVLGLALFGGITLLADPAAAYFNNPAVGEVLPVIALIFVFNAFSNLNLIVCQRDNDFASTVKVQVTAKVLSSVTTIVLAYIYQSYWVLAIGMLVNSSASMLFSHYYAIPWLRMRFLADLAKDIFGFSKWFLLLQLFDFGNQKINVMAVAKSFETKFVGFFSLGQELTQLFATEVNNALDSANFSELSRLKRSGDNFTQVLMDNLKTVSSMKVVLLTPLYAAFVFYPDIVIAVLLGNNWTEMAPYLQYFALAAYFTSFQTSYSNCLLVYREPKINFYVSVLNLILKVLVLVVAIFYKEPLLVAVGDVFIQISKMLFLQVALRLKSGIPLWQFNKLLAYDSVFVGVTILCYGLMSLIPNVAEIWKFIAAVSLIVVFILYLLCSQSNYYDYLRHLVKPVLMARIAMITQRFSR